MPPPGLRETNAAGRPLGPGRITEGWQDAARASTGFARPRRSDIFNTSPSLGTAALWTAGFQRDPLATSRSGSRGGPPGVESAAVTSGLEAALWRFTYDTVVRTGRGPSLREGSAVLGASESEIRAAYQRLSEEHAIVLDPSGEALWRIAPFSAVPTDFAVEAGGRSYFGNCAWDALGICAALHADGVVRASCGCCRVPMEIVVRHDRIETDEGVVHIAVPARDWYQDVTFT
jgi:hypothetical protein